MYLKIRFLHFKIPTTVTPLNKPPSSSYEAEILHFYWFTGIVKERRWIYFYCHRWSYQRFTYSLLYVCVSDIWPCMLINLYREMGDLANGLWNWLLGIHLRILFPFVGRWFLLPLCALSQITIVCQLFIAFNDEKVLYFSPSSI